jgi:hypothetical protein
LFACIWRRGQILPVIAEDVSGAATCIQRMQKALTQTNIQLTNVISDLSGVTGQMIVRAIVGGGRRKLAELSHPRTQASRGQIAESLEGNWRQELKVVSRDAPNISPPSTRRPKFRDEFPKAPSKNRNFLFPFWVTIFLYSPTP